MQTNNISLIYGPFVHAEDTMSDAFTVSVEELTLVLVTLILSVGSLLTLLTMNFLLPVEPCLLM